jgi:hypothetical protein
MVEKGLHGCRPIRILRRTFVLAWLLFPPIICGSIFLSLRIVGSYDLAFVAGGFMFAVFAAAACALRFWPCPQCGHRFVRYNMYWPRKCQHCSFPC